MLTRLSKTIDRIATRRNALLLLLSLLPFIFIFFPWRSKQLGAMMGYSQRTFDTRLPYTPQDVHIMADDLGAAGRLLYGLTEVTLDFVFPVLYATWLSVTLAWVWRKALPEWSGRCWLILLPYLGMLADFAENTCLAILMLLFPNEPTWLVWLSNTVSLVKWCAGLASFGFILIGLGVQVIQLFRCQNR
jgi:hypothetical protein